MDQPLSPVNNATYVDQPGSMHLQQTQSQTLSDIPGATNAELSVDAGYYSTSPSQLVYPTAPPSLHTTPNTPTSIPDIILTGKYTVVLNLISSNHCKFDRFVVNPILFC